MADELSGIRRAVAIAGTQKILAEQCGVLQGRVSDWCIRGYVPKSRAPIVARATGVPLADLIRPLKQIKARKRGKAIPTVAAE
jgi:DNA-binding transcriptional regulator YdaS (Cro superfamily)